MSANGFANAVPLPIDAIAGSGAGVRLEHCCATAGIHTFAELSKLTEAEALKIKHFGRKTLKEAATLLNARGLAFCPSTCGRDSESGMGLVRRNALRDLQQALSRYCAHQGGGLWKLDATSQPGYRVEFSLRFDDRVITTTLAERRLEAPDAVKSMMDDVLWYFRQQVTRELRDRVLFLEQTLPR